MYFDPENRADDKLGKVRDPIAKAAKYVKTRSPKEKLVMLCAGGLLVRSPLVFAVRSQLITSLLGAAKHLSKKAWIMTAAL